MFKIKDEITFRKPALSITPPKIIADITSHIVPSIPYIPLDERRSETKSLDVDIEIEPYNDFIIPINNEVHSSELFPETSTTKSLWKIKAKTDPSITPTNNAGTALIFLYIRIITVKGTRNNIGEI